ncbi:MAG: Omp28-related outer membrane protein [Bacteroidales bacterium]|nr:Omp28-related outer membrane protein [Bacteroidales bacterium]
MKRNLALMILLLSFVGINLNAQTMVSTEPQKRNVIIEDFTGVNCPNCADGHKIANSLMDYYEDRVWAINIHAGNYAGSQSYNFKTEDGTAILSGFNVTGFPQAVINRTTENGVSRTDWASHTNLIVEEDAECNVAGRVVIDYGARKATVTVEVYYTANSNADENYLNVFMLQDNIIAYQSGADQNPDQMYNGQYRHMHAFRDAITPTWGDAISPTTEGSFVTKTYTYDIPEKIGSFDVEIDDLEFIAFVTEQYQGTATRPVLNANELDVFKTTNQDVYPEIVSLNSSSKFSCSNEKVIEVSVINSGSDEITSLKFEVTVDGKDATTQTWEGSIASYQTVMAEVKAVVPEGEHEVEVKIVEANNADFEESETITLTSEKWNEVKTETSEEELTIELTQDKYGNQITWELLASDYSVLASGGPYEILKGASATETHHVKVTVPAGECVKFIIRDSKENGICCQFGEGNYRILDSEGNAVVEGAGDFGAEASHVISIVSTENVASVEYNKSSVEVWPNPTNDNLNIEAKSMSRITLINALGQVVLDKAVDGDNELLDLSKYETGIYMLRVNTEEGVVMRRVVIGN